jgi:hypothetical protein
MLKDHDQDHKIVMQSLLMHSCTCFAEFGHNVRFGPRGRVLQDVEVICAEASEGCVV